MRILFFGDIVGKAGRQAIQKFLPELRLRESPDFVIANVENLAHGRGVTKQTLEEIFAAGVDIATSGNHIFDKKEQLSDIMQTYAERILRPANIDETLPGKGSLSVEKNGKRMLVLNLLGQTFMEKQWEGTIASPFETLSKLLDYADPRRYGAVLLDFHAEATSEKIAMGWYADGKLSAVLGTHTHVPTADFRILPKGTAYITDVGMTGVADSIIGVDREAALARFLGQQSVLHPASGSPVAANYVILEVHEEARTAIRLAHHTEMVSLSPI